MSKHKFEVFIHVELRKKVPVTGANDGRSEMWVSDGYETKKVFVEVDIDRLAKELGPRALRSKGKKAVEAGGAVVVWSDRG